MKGVLSNYTVDIAAKIAGVCNLVIAAGIFMRLISIIVLFPRVNSYLIGFLVPFGLKITLATEGAIALLSILVAIGLLTRRTALSVYPGFLLCAFMVGYEGLWGITTFHLSYRIPFIIFSVAFPLAVLIVYAQLFFLLIRLTKKTENDA